MTNARTARDWALAKLGSEDAVAKHFVAVSTNAEGVAEFGIDTDNMFGFWDWVGGRYSMDSAIGLSTMLAIGPDALRRDAGRLPRRWTSTSHERRSAQSLPVLMGLLPSGTRDFFGAQTVGVLALRPVPEALPGLSAAAHHGVERQARHPRWRPGRLRHRRDLLGRARDQRPAFLLPAAPPGDEADPLRLHRLHASTLNPLGDHHDLLMSNVFAQAEALAFGKTPEQVREEGTPEAIVPHRVMEGNRPSNVILADRLTPHTLGTLVALYEHSVFTQGAIWGIDSFDQWGVELGKVLAVKIIPELQAPEEPKLEHDSSTNNLIRRYRANRSRVSAMSLEQYERVLEVADRRARSYLAGVDARPVAEQASVGDLRKSLDRKLPTRARIRRRWSRSCADAAEPGLIALASPRYFGFVIGGTLPAALGADWLAGAWDQIASLYVCGPSAAVAEEVSGRWVLEVLGLPTDAGFGLTTGGTMANFSGIAAGRHAVLQRAGWDVEAKGLNGAPQVRVLVGELAHATIFVALRLLGLGSENAIRVRADDAGRMDPEALAAELDRWRGRPSSARRPAR